MKILHIIRSVNPEGGGPIEGIVQLSNIHINNGHNVEILSLDSPNDDFISECPLLVHAQGPGLGKYGYSSNFIKWLDLNCNNYDFFIINGIWQYHSFATHKVLKKHNKPYFLFTHGMLDPWFNKQYPIKHLKKILYWLWGEYPVLKDAKKVLFTCNEEKILSRQSFYPYKCNEQVVNFGTKGHVGDKEYQIKLFYDSFPVLKSNRFILFLSRIHPKKGIDLLIQAFAEVSDLHPDLYLVIAGPDQIGLLNDLIILCDKLNISDKVIWTGMLKNDIKWGAYLSAEAFILPSHQENFGIVVAEALSCSTPVLISNKVNIWREIEDDKAGFIDEDTVNGCVNLLTRWLTLSSDLKADFKINALNCFNKRFYIDNAAHNLLEILYSQ